MVAPLVVFDTDPTQVKITWTALSPALSGGLPLIEYQIQIQTSSSSY